MKYLIVTSSAESCEYAKLLVEEIQRFDIRSQIFFNTSNGNIEELNEERSFVAKYKSLKAKLLKEQNFDSLIIVGESFDKKIAVGASRLGIDTYFFQLTSSYSKGKLVNQLAAKTFNKVFIDLPIYGKHGKNVQIGHYQNDLIRKHDFNSNESDELRIGLLINEKKHANKLHKLITDFSSKSKEAKWMVANREVLSNTKFESLDNVRLSHNRFDLLKNVNAVIVDSEVDSITAALLNCPQVSISGRYGIFGFSKEKTPLLNKLSEEGLVKHFSPNQHELISDELIHLLNDHEYCAAMLTSYQILKEKIGTQPVAREAVRMIVEWLEEK